VKEKVACALAALCALWTLTEIHPWGGASAQEQGPTDWRAEFEAVCVKTDLAMSLSTDELTDLVARCDRLETQIAGETEIVRKVYLKRLRSCRALFVYVLESRGDAAAGGGSPAPPQPSPPEPQLHGTDAPAAEIKPTP